MEAVSKALHPDSKEKLYYPDEIIRISKQLLVQVLDLPFDSKSRKMIDLLKTFEGLDINKYANIMQCKDWTISNYIGSPTLAKQVIVHHKKLNLKVKFVDMLTYLQPMELKQAAKDFEQTQGLSSANGYDDKKGLFPYKAFNTNNVNEVLSKSEPFTM
ncbi:MAG: hypothetical protein EZS28_038702, partial [Streblomastix strix]